MPVSFTGGRVQEEGGSEDIAVRPPTEGSAPTCVVMIGSLMVVVVLCGVAAAQESVLVKGVAGRRDGSRVELQEESESNYPIIVQQPFPIIVEKRIPYNEQRYDRKPNPRIYTSTGTEFGFRPEVVRSPIIFAVSSQPAHSRIPYPLRIQKDTWPSPCAGDPICLDEEPDYPAKYPPKKKNTYNSAESKKEVIERDATISSDYENKEGSVQHRETFQSPILIAIEKPGYKYVKHLVGKGILPKARQFHVLILEEDVSTDNPNNSTESEQKDVSESPSSDDIVQDNKQEYKEEEKKEKREVSDSADGKIIFASTKEESKVDSNETPCEYDIEKDDAKAKIDIKKK